MAALNINGYIITDGLRSENAGNSSWGCAFKNEKKFFIKQLKDTYYDIPYEKANVFQRESMELSRLFFERINRLFEALKKADNGNIIAPIEFIRQDGHYYIISEWVDQFSDFGEIKGFSPFNKHLMMKVLAYSVYGLSNHRIVHCDLKPDNIRIKETVNKTKTLKIIDFDSSFIEEDYPDTIVGDQTYMAPEVIMRISQDEEDLDNNKIEITTKADIFSLGIIFHEILTGELPISNNQSHHYIGVAVGHGDNIILSDEINQDYAGLIQSMLQIEPSNRPTALSVFNSLSGIDPLKTTDRR